mgnify:CR=1 FL=1
MTTTTTAKRPTPRWTLWFAQRQDANRYAIFEYGSTVETLEYVHSADDGGYEVEIGLLAPPCATCGHRRKTGDARRNRAWQRSIIERTKLAIVHAQGVAGEALVVPVVKLLRDGEEVSA